MSSCDSMSFRLSFSRFRKKAKEKVLNIRDRIRRYGAGVQGEGLNHSTLSLQSEPAIAVEGVENDDPRPDAYPPVSRSTAELEREPARGSDDYTVRQERGQRALHPQAYERAGPGSSRERADAGGKETGPRSKSDIRRIPTVSILQDPESESTWAAPPQSPPLTDDAANPGVFGAATSKDESEWKHTVSSAAKLTLRTVKEASDAFPPLRSIAGGLCAILDNCEVRSAIVRSICDAYGIPSERRSTNKRLNRWDTGSRHSIHSADLLRVTSRRKQGEGNWHSKPTLPRPRVEANVRGLTGN